MPIYVFFYLPYLPILLFTLLVLGLVCFAITLHCTNSKGVLDLQHLEDVKDEEHEMQVPSFAHLQAEEENDQMINNNELNLQNNIEKGEKIKKEVTI